MKKEYYFGCTNQFGKNDPKEVFYKAIYPVLAKYKLKEKDIDYIASHIQEMCSIAYDNGAENEAFTQAESEW